MKLFFKCLRRLCSKQIVNHDGIIRYDCKENDNHMFMDKENAEILVGDCLEREWTVIGLDDLTKALSKIGYSIVSPIKIHIDCDDKLD